jgi:hypothetical protein
MPSVWRKPAFGKEDAAGKKWIGVEMSVCRGRRIENADAVRQGEKTV